MRNTERRLPYLCDATVPVRGQNLLMRRHADSESSLRLTARCEMEALLVEQAVDHSAALARLERASLTRNAGSVHGACCKLHDMGGQPALFLAQGLCSDPPEHRAGTCEAER